MNYSYEAAFNGSPDMVHFSDGRFAKLRMRETDLDETLPFPIGALAFLAKDPYRFPLRAAGAATEVDWNRNGIFGEKGVRADINYQPSSYLGDRFDVETTATSPVAACRRSSACRWRTTTSTAGGSNGMLKCAFNGTGIQSDEMGDFDELRFIRTQGLRQSLGAR